MPPDSDTDDDIPKPIDRSQDTYEAGWRDGYAAGLRQGQLRPATSTKVGTLNPDTDNR